MQRRREDVIREELARAGLYQGLTVRALSVRAGTADNDTVRWVLTTEQPAMVWDWDRWDFVDEVLIASGMEVPASRQVPFLDSHSRRSVDDILGSVSDFSEVEVAGYRGVDGLVRFASDERGQMALQKVRDGHLTDGSVGYEVTRAVWIPEDEEAVVDGRTWRGPLKVSYRWRLKEFSGTPIGADTLAKVRSLCSRGVCR